MTALDDFIAQDPVSREFVKLDGNIQWTEMQVRDRTEAILESIYPVQAQRILSRKVDAYNLSKTLAMVPDPALPLPAFDLSAAEKADLMNFSVVSTRCGELKDFMWARAQLVSDAIQYENWRMFLDSLGPMPEPPAVDPNADMRAQLQAILDGYAQATKDLVAQRDAWRAGQ